MLRCILEWLEASGQSMGSALTQRDMKLEQGTSRWCPVIGRIMNQRDAGTSEFDQSSFCFHSEGHEDNV
jgi:hypothetical protein